MTEKICIKCHKNRAAKSYCKECYAAYSRQWREENPNYCKRVDGGGRYGLDRPPKNRGGSRRQKKVVSVEQPKDRILKLISLSAARSSEKSIPFNISFDYLYGLYLEQEESCALTGIPFVFDRGLWSRSHPYSMSLDRKVPELGYIEGNVRLVLYCVNCALNEFGDEILREWAKKYVDKQGL